MAQELSREITIEDVLPAVEKYLAETLMKVSA
jgi:hypothetical protein